METYSIPLYLLLYYTKYSIKIQAHAQLHTVMESETESSSKFTSTVYDIRKFCILAKYWFAYYSLCRSLG